MINTNFSEKDLVLDAEIQEGEHTGSKAKDLFCSQWENARIGLTTLQLLTSKKTIFSFILGIVITVGDKIQNKFCKQ